MSRAIGLDLRLGAALAASLAVHVAAMTLSLPAPRLAPFEAPALLQVRLLEPRLLVPEAAQPPAQAAGQSVVGRRVPEKREIAPLARTDSPPPATAYAEVLDQAPAPVPEPSVTPAMTPPMQPAQVAAHSSAPRTSASEMLSGYGQTVSHVLARYKEYPPIALMRGWEGSVTMRLRVAPSGRLIDVELHTSSGHDLLDKQALAMVTRAQPLPLPPDELRGGEIAVLVPIVFRLER